VVKVAPRSGEPVLYQAAERAAGYWRFKPYQQNGQAVKVNTEFEVPFRPVQLAQVQPPQQQPSPSSYQTQPVQQPVQTPAAQPPPAQPSHQSPQPPAQRTQPLTTPPTAAPGEFATRAVHRVRLINGMSCWCTGNLVITSDGSLSYSNDASSRAMSSYINVCRSFRLRLNKQKHVDIDPSPQLINGYQFVHLHVEKGWSHKDDLYIPAKMAGGLDQIMNPWLR
jgi:hypothetical protein